MPTDMTAPTEALDPKGLAKLARKYCEGWCEDGGQGQFTDCTGCEIYAALASLAGQAAPPELQSQTPAGGTIRSEQGNAMEAVPETGHPPVGMASPTFATQGQVAPVGWRYRLFEGRNAQWLFVPGEWPQAWGDTAWEREPLFAAPPPPAPIGWRCFHCDEVFETQEAALAHFGPHELCDPACQIDVAKYRQMEDLHERHLTETDEASTTFHAMRADHVRALIREEEKGYAKGLADGRALAAPAPIGVSEARDMLEEGRAYESDRVADLMIKGEPFYSGPQFRAAYRHGYDLAMNDRASPPVAPDALVERLLARADIEEHGAAISADGPVAVLLREAAAALAGQPTKEGE